jgi:tetratricopeptide (TPR) repeat protein
VVGAVHAAAEQHDAVVEHAHAGNLFDRVELATQFRNLSDVPPGDGRKVIAGLVLRGVVFGKKVEAESFVTVLVVAAPAAVPAGAGDSGSLAPPELSRALAGSPAPAGTVVPAATVAAATQQAFDDAVVRLEAGDYAGARPILEQLVVSEPTLAAPAVNLGMLHAREGRWPEAESSLQEGIRRDAASAVAYNELAAVQREAGRFADAEASYRQALAADPGHYRTHRNFAVLLDLYLWRPAEALQHFESYLSMSGTADRQVSGWIAELKRRVGEVAQSAGVQP